MPIITNNYSITPLQARHQSALIQLAHSQQVYPASANDHLTLTALDFQAQLIGYIVWQFASDEASLLGIAVSPNYQRRGIAQNLYHHSQPYLQTHHITTSFLEVRQSNLPAQQLYQKLGYQRIAKRHHYYPPTPSNQHRETAFIYRKTHRL